MTTKNVLVGIQLTMFKHPPIGSIYRFQVYNLGAVRLLSVEDQLLNFNYQINGSDKEKVVMRVFFQDKKTIKKVLFYYLDTMDPELAKYLVQEQVMRLLKKYKLSSDFKFKLLKSEVLSGVAIM